MVDGTFEPFPNSLPSFVSTERKSHVTSLVSKHVGLKEHQSGYGLSNAIRKEQVRRYCCTSIYCWSHELLPLQRLTGLCRFRFVCACPFVSLGP